ncbi:hypothetical protein DM02DRAFT_664974 [Periconia macrospinosa]|uniref:Uncharacterized protein n=1 Tax=Periconia macrospinosa TaxID=97972 RepID=A0A2V1CXQ5_9PLEO|nr:hypothetical protein DM02DRAFT_664974 [Periconia macrospinosa]
MQTCTLFRGQIMLVLAEAGSSEGRVEARIICKQWAKRNGGLGEVQLELGCPSIIMTAKGIMICVPNQLGYVCTVGQARPRPMLIINLQATFTPGVAVKPSPRIYTTFLRTPSPRRYK